MCTRVCVCVWGGGGGGMHVCTRVCVCGGGGGACMCVHMSIHACMHFTEYRFDLFTILWNYQWFYSALYSGYAYNIYSASGLSYLDTILQQSMTCLFFLNFHLK